VRIASWNVNSVGARIDRVVEWLDSAQPDVVALQELKCTDEAFPHMPIHAAGYEPVTHGTGRWNGVAILTRVGDPMLLSVWLVSLNFMVLPSLAHSVLHAMVF